MHVTLIGPDEGHTSTHKIDAGAAAMLAVQLSKRHIAVSETGVELAPPPKIEITIDDETLWVSEGRVKFWTQGDRFDGELTLTLEKR